MKPWILGLLVLSAAAAPGWSAAERWTPFGPPAGPLLDLAAGPEGRLFLAAAESGVAASGVGGQSWSWSGVGMGSERVEALAADTASGVLYAAGDSRFFRSADAGATWQTLATGLPFGALVAGNGCALALVPGDPEIFFVACGSSLYRGSAGGTSWQAVLSASSAIASLVVDPNDPRSVFAGTAQPDGHLWHSADQGDTWTKVTVVDPLPFPPPVSPFEYGVSALAAAPTSPTAFFAIAGLSLYRSVDAGATWHKLDLAPESVGYIESVLVIPGSPPTLVTTQDVPGSDGFAHDGVFVSSDLGTSWSRVDSAGGPFGKLLSDPANGDLFTLTTEGLGRSTDGGAHWQVIPVGEQASGVALPARPGGRLLFTHSPARELAVSGSRLFVSQDGGASWSPRGDAVVAFPKNDKFFDVAIDPRHDATLYAGTPYGVMGSLDAGVTWRYLLSGQSGELLPFDVLAVPVSGTVLAGYCGVQRSTNAGKSWKQTLGCDVPELGDDFGRMVNRLVLDPLRPQVVYAEVVEAGGRHPPQAFPAVFRSDDGGGTWHRLISGADVIAVDPRTSRILYALTPSGLLKSVDDGKTWKKISDFSLGLGSFGYPLDGDLKVDPADSRLLYAARPDGVWRSRDRGVTWEIFSTGLRGRPAYSLFPDPWRRTLVVGSEGFFRIGVR